MAIYPLASGGDLPFLESVTAMKNIFTELHYEITQKLAEGGMGIVYEAVQHGAGHFRKVVALKIIREEFSAIPEFQKNFIGEARLVATSSTPISCRPTISGRP